MGRRKKGNPVHGWVILDKPQGMTSTQAVGVVRRLFDAQKAGHAGTLDPLATGVLPIALGEATKTVPFAVDGAKAYRFTVRWGAGTNTDDAEGEIVETSAVRPSRDDIEGLLGQFIGDILQVPPAFSALKIEGERAYDLARSGEVVELQARPVAIDRFELMEMPDADTAVFEAACGKGTYVRALARDLGRQLGCFGHVIALRRTQVGTFDVEGATTLEELRRAADLQDGGAELASRLHPIGRRWTICWRSMSAGRMRRVSCADSQCCCAGAMLRSSQARPLQCPTERLSPCVRLRPANCGPTGCSTTGEAPL
jgi:tRNA pseudouridine55 synthase